MGIFEVVLGVIMIFTNLKDTDKYSKTVVGKNVMVKLMFVSVFAGFAKGFFGAGWGPIGVGLFILLGLDPRMVVGSSLVMRLLLDCASGLTYATFNMVDFNSVLILTLTGSMAVPVAVKLTKNVSEKNLCMFLGGIIVILGALVVSNAIPTLH
jgi:uncharacterized membrane protein YfcA